MSLDKAAVWSFVHAERARLADDLATVAPHAWATPSLCPGWDVHDVLAHLVDTAKTSRIGFARQMIAARLDFDSANAAGIARERRADARDTLAAMREVVRYTRTPVAPRPTRLVEAIVHGEDIRRPLGIATSYASDAVAAALTYQLAPLSRWAAAGSGWTACDSSQPTARSTPVRVTWCGVAPSTCYSPCQAGRWTPPRSPGREPRAWSPASPV